MSTLLAGGCPPGAGPLGTTGDPPGGTADPVLIITASGSTTLQAAEGGVFPNQVALTAVLFNVEDVENATYQWSVQAGEGVVGLSGPATNPTVTVVVNNAPPSTQTAVIAVTATFQGESGIQSLTASISLLIEPDEEPTEATTLTAAPFADPPLGVDAANQVTLHANISGETGEVRSVVWQPLVTLPAGIQVSPAAMDADPLVLTVAEGVGGVFPFQVTVRDAANNVAVGIVNVMLGFDLDDDVGTFVGLDVQAAQLHVAPPVEGSTTFADLLRTARSSGTAPFSYSWTVLNSAGAAVAITPAIASGSSTADAQIDWNVVVADTTAADTYRFFATVTDGAGSSFTASAEIFIGPALSLDVQAANLQIPPGASGAALVRSFRQGGSPAFAYTWRVLDAAGDDVIASFGGQPTASPNSAAAEIDWSFSTTAVAAGTYRFVADLTDGLGRTFTASAEILIAQDLSLDVRTDDLELDQFGPADPATLTFDVTGGVCPHTFTFDAFPLGGGAGVGNDYFDPDSPATSTCAAPDLTVSFDSESGSPLGLGFYVIVVTVTDSAGNAFTDSITLEVIDSGG